MWHMRFLPSMHCMGLMHGNSESWDMRGLHAWCTMHACSTGRSENCWLPYARLESSPGSPIAHFRACTRPVRILGHPPCTRALASPPHSRSFRASYSFLPFPCSSALRERIWTREGRGGEGRRYASDSLSNERVTMNSGITGRGLPE